MKTRQGFDYYAYQGYKQKLFNFFVGFNAILSAPLLLFAYVRSDLAVAEAVAALVLVSYIAYRLLKRRARRKIRD